MRFRYVVSFTLGTERVAHQPRYAVPYLCKLFPCFQRPLCSARPATWDELKDILLAAAETEEDYLPSMEETNWFFSSKWKVPPANAGADSLRSTLRLLLEDVKASVPVVAAPTVESVLSKIATIFETRDAYNQSLFVLLWAGTAP